MRRLSACPPGSAHHPRRPRSSVLFPGCSTEVRPGVLRRPHPQFYAEKGFVSDPKRCTGCRASRRTQREGSDYDAREIGGPRGYERGGDRPAREYFAVICSRCGNAAQVPFRPRMDKPVYCSDCFRALSAG